MACVAVKQFTTLSLLHPFPAEKYSALFQLLLVEFDFRLILLDVDAYAAVPGHVNIGHPYECKSGNEIAAPIRVKEFVLRDDEEKNHNVMTETIFTREEVEEFPDRNVTSMFAHVYEVFSRLTKNFFVRNRPGNAGNGQCQHEQDEDIMNGDNHAGNVQIRCLCVGASVSDGCVRCVDRYGR